LFDVSHMGQIRIAGENPASALERLVTNDLQRLRKGQTCYNLFTNETGGILDDLMVTQMGDHLFVVVNAACKEQDFRHLGQGLGDDAEASWAGERALLALQGPAAAAIMFRHASAAENLVFMTAAEMEVAGVRCLVSRSGYTGEDGFEISVAAEHAEALARTFLAEDEVEPVGLGARDSLRLEAGLCLYGHDIDETTTPVQAGLIWAIGKRRRAEGGFPGWRLIVREIEEGPVRRRIGILPEGRAPAREGTEITSVDGEPIGEVTSGGFGPSVGGPIAMGYVRADHAVADTSIQLVVRGTPRPARVVRLPFVKSNYHKP